ncbi:hypothetical protein M0Q97_09625 [Candidatus Dojkabacteria bacterium]|jgi:hypothetical protein|nr:hypothetical protein [Candidatus Dojkabacteria bacterium]
MSKLKIGIDINEVLRAKWLQFDRFYAQEFGEDGIPEQPYVYDFFLEYPWKDTVEEIKEMREPEDIPENINPIDYQIDDKGEAPADFMLFKPKEKVELTARQVYNRFMYEDFLFELHGAAPKMYSQLDLDVNNFLEKYGSTVDFTVMSVENKFSIPPTLFFLSKIQARFKDYKFLDNSLDMWKHVDILITTDPKIIQLGAPWGKKLIKLKRPYNEKINNGSLEVLQIADLINNQNFQKIIKYKIKSK